MSLIEKAIAPDEVEGDLLRLLYIPLSAFANLGDVLSKGNPKNHELNKLRTSISENGFIDPAKWDINLNNGKGGIIYGNGRTEALVALLQQMQKANEPAPRGIGVHKNTQEWCIPVKFGVDAKSELAAKRFIIDHNLLTASGLSVVDASAMFKTEAYLEVLEELDEQGALPITVDVQDYLELIDKEEKSQSTEEEEEEGSDDQERVSQRSSDQERDNQESSDQERDNQESSDQETDNQESSDQETDNQESSDQETDNPKKTDSGMTYKNKFAIAIECEDEVHQEKVYNNLVQQGYKCRILVL